MQAAKLIELRKGGAFRISRRFFFTNPDLVRDVLKNVMVTSARTSVVSDSIEYEGFSEAFDPIPEGTEMPTYRIHVVMKDGKYLPKWMFWKSERI